MMNRMQNGVIESTITDGIIEPFISKKLETLCSSNYFGVAKLETIEPVKFYVSHLKALEAHFVVKWLNDTFGPATKNTWEIIHITPPHSAYYLQFYKPNDAMLFKLTWGHLGDNRW